MELKTGYKQTEVGVIPEEWSVKRLGEIATIVTGNTPPTRDAANYGDEFLFVSPFDLGEDKHITRTEKKLSKKGFGITRCFPKDSILFVCIGSTIGKCGIAPIELTSNQQINAIFPSPTFSSDYLYYSVCALAPKVRALAGEQAVPIVNKTQFAETIVAFPPLPEQRAIAGALGDVDALLGALEKLIAKKRDLKQAAMQQLLTGQKRLHGFGKANKLMQTEIGLIPEDWSVSTFKNLFDITAGGDLDPKKSKSYQDETYYYPIYSNALTNRGLYGYCSYKNYPSDSITITARGTLGVANFRDHAYTAIGRVLVLIPKGELDGRFFAEVINNRVKFAIESTGVPQLTAPQISNYKLPIPSFPEQTAIAAVLSDMDAELAALEQWLAKTRALKQGMMQELLTGRVRLI